ncbi:type II secretion system major pseudopilin GspG [Sandaracinobacteroides saxicola]|uniref:Type II secretion system core protein G n=1 Tax=Sandaracinobacteroides saxicola TaxID=2759707 RepID=A0A7G5IMM4_9SPHN|nr:type II secretion system major pseudopilin GspG [Sandaracinobacteroides saxicola]
MDDTAVPGFGRADPLPLACRKSPPPQAGEGLGPFPPCEAADRRANGFTLTELLVVLAIIGLLTTIVVLNVLPMQDRAAGTKARADVAAIEQALELYRLDMGRYPTMEEGLVALTKPTPASGALLKTLPDDPWQRPYQYRQPGIHGPVDVFSLGSDGAEGGEQTAADIGNWKPAT